MGRALFPAGLAALLLAGCALPPPRPDAPPAAGFELSGRLAAKQGERGFSGGLRWQHGAARDEVWVLTPLGQAVAHIVQTPGEARYTAASGEVHVARDAEALAAKLLGFRLPLSGLRHWVVGDAAPGHPGAGELDAAGQLKRLTQDGWTVEYQRYGEFGGRTLPKTLALTREGLELRLTVDEWSFAP